MDKLPAPILSDVLEVISTANESMDFELLRQKVFDAIFRTISADGAIFFLPDTRGRLTYIKIRNLDNGYCDLYKTYFNKFDPLQLTKGWSIAKWPTSLENIFSYDSFLGTEYYNDFLKPQKIHHKLIVNLVADKELHGRIVLTRPRVLNSFTSSELLTVRTISPYLAHALAHNNLRRKIRLKGTLLDYIEKQSSLGIILLDEKLQTIYRNDKAGEVLGDLTLSGWSLDRGDQLPPQLLRDCQEIKADLRNCPAGGTSISRQSTIQGADNSSFTITSQVLDQGQDWEGALCLMVSIEKQMPAQKRSQAKIDPSHLIDEFDLSKREVDVVELLFLGLKNAQIAQRLFVSEVTVKKHLQNIYEKVGVRSRTALINQILST